MTDRYDAFVVVLERDIREDDAKAIVGAIEMLKGVAAVSPHVQDIESLIAATRVRVELRDKLLRVLEGL